MSASSSVAALHPCESGAGHGMFSHVSSSSFERSSTLRVPVPGSASALRKNLYGAGGPMSVDHGLSSSKRMRRRFAGSSTLRSKNLDGAGGPRCVGPGLRSSGSKSRSFADSSALKGQVVDGKAWNCSQSSDFDDLFVPCTSPSQRVHLVDSVVRLSSSQDTHDMHGDMNSCGSVHGGGVHDNSSGVHEREFMGCTGAQEFM